MFISITDKDNKVYLIRKESIEAIIINQQEIVVGLLGEYETITIQVSENIDPQELGFELIKKLG